MKHLLIFLLLVSLSSVHCLNKSEEDFSAPPAPSGKSFFLFGAIFRKFRQRWAGHHDPGGPSGPYFAGPVYPLYGYQNCPAYGCNPALIYRPAPYEPPPSIYYHQQLAPYPPNIVYAPPPPQSAQQVPQQQQQQQQQQQMHQQSNVVIYHQSPTPYGYYAPYPPVHTWSPYGANAGPNVGVGGVSQYPPPYPIGNYVPIAPAPSPSYSASPGYVPLPLPPTQPGPAYGPSVATAVSVAGQPVPAYGPPVGTAVDAPPPPPCNAQMYSCPGGK